jgi:lipopolysaccharide/colanic/teichoic acid biosynthesis glycosyltransferase
MLKNSPNLGTGSLTLRNDPRLTPMGKFLRKTKINEIPQVLNILKGEMSLIGPRPQPQVDFIKYPIEVQKTIYNVRPGLTGVASIVFRDEEKLISNVEGDKHEFYKSHIAPYKGELESWYQQHLSFSTDSLLILLTIWTVIAPESNLMYKLISDLPPIPEQLRRYISFQKN